MYVSLRERNLDVVLVEEKFGKTGEVKEAIYNTLNEHHIEIPFPQRDIHIIASN